ncbi:K+ channel tetramerization domain protein [Ancylostoma caninum]|uniref:K+ channel tetramerization domain protein n=1 Tax=Ancylostoma caninum TaxID=29170 RepID=A0A368GNI8_ANCCA|nr:K+ channel tetramerization domain protein [Ancylostoma caninum]
MSAVPVVLNVGGTKFFTTAETLTSPSAGENSYFANLDYTKGEIFIDRDPTVFKYILNYLRDGRVMFPDDGLTTGLMFQEVKLPAQLLSVLSENYWSSYVMSNIVVLNVGGERFTTTRETLMSNLCRENTYFANLDDYKGEIFIDRDPKVFMFILNYLRDGKVAIPEDQFVRTRIRQEAEYFCMDKLATMIDFAEEGRTEVIEAIKWYPAPYD